MTHPTEIKPREGEHPGTPWAAFEATAALPPVSFTVTPEIVADYMAAVDANPEVYRIDGRDVAPPNLLAVYLLSILYRKYPPIQGIILTHQSWRWRRPIWADEETPIVADGQIAETYRKRDKAYVRWQARFADEAGEAFATAENTVYVPQ